MGVRSAVLRTRGQQEGRLAAVSLPAVPSALGQGLRAPQDTRHWTEEGLTLPGDRRCPPAGTYMPLEAQSV